VLPLRPPAWVHTGPAAATVGYRGAGMASVTDELNANVRGYDRHYGLHFEACSDTEVRARVAVRDELLQPYGLIHGGVYASMAESITSIATALGVGERGEIAMGLSNNTSFLRPITAGAVHASAVRVHRGRTTWVWDVTFTDDEGRTCALTRMTIAVRAMGEGPGGRPAGG
jgi:1,4-dihydroxy-2-naphthoyl-CoA hydrolase